MTGTGVLTNFEYPGTFITGLGDDTIVTRSSNRDVVIDTSAGDDAIFVAGGFDEIAAGSGSTG